MTISKMRYKGFSWVHNPMTLKVTKEQVLREQYIPYGNSAVQDMGVKSRIVSGTGQLYGKDCLEMYNQLLKLQSLEGSGILSLPDTKPFYAFFKSIELACEPKPELVTYNFVFVEDLSAQKNDAQPYYHTVQYLQTLWDIAYEYGVDIDTLVGLNPQIKRIDELEAGERVRVC